MEVVSVVFVSLRPKGLGLFVFPMSLYDSRLWRNGRRRHLAANPLCVFCQQLGRITPATVVDHRTPHKGDSSLFFDQDNWQSLCKLCHDSVKQRIEHGKMVQPVSVTGEPIDPGHWWSR